MRNISFSLTEPQIRSRTKTVTRRLGWATLKPGTLLQPVEKSRGLQRGEKVQPIGPPIRVVKVTREPLSALSSPDECAREGFPELSPSEFVRMFCATHRGCTPQSQVTRIEFEFVD
jgi:hypothetical protein